MIESGQNDAISNQISISVSSTSMDVSVEDVEDVTCKNLSVECHSSMDKEILKSSSSALHGCGKFTFIRDEVSNLEDFNKPKDCVIVVETKTEEGRYI